MRDANESALNSHMDKTEQSEKDYEAFESELYDEVYRDYNDLKDRYDRICEKHGFDNRTFSEWVNEQ